MTKEDLERFKSALKAALLAGVPLEIVSDNTTRTALDAKKLDVYCGELAMRLDAISIEIDDHPLTTTSKSEVLNGLPSRLVAAIKSYQRVGSMAPVLDCLSSRCIATHQARKALRPMWFYLTFLSLVAFAGLYVFAIFVEPTISSLRADSSIIASENTPPQTQFLPLSTALLFVGIVLLSIFAWCLLGGTKKLTHRLGGSSYARLRTMAVALNMSELLAASGVPVGAAISQSCELAGVDIGTQEEIKLFGLGHTVERANHYSRLADRRLHNLKYRTTILITSLAGGLICVVYGLIVFQPISAMLMDIGKAAS